MKEGVSKALIECALALQRGEWSCADLEMKNLLDLAAEELHAGDRRIIKYFAEGLARREFGLLPSDFKGSNWEEHRRNMFSIFWIANSFIKDVIRGKSKVHIIDVSFFYFFEISLQWTKLMDRLGDQRPRSFRLSVIVRENNNTLYKEREEELTRKARAKGIVFEVKKILVDNLVDIDESLVEIENDEFVVVNSLFELSKLLSKAGDLQKVLQRVRDAIKPNFMVIAEHDADHNQSDFVLRINESFKYYSALLGISWDSLDDDDEQHYRYEISNIVACEGSKRVHRHQTLVQWRSLLINSGFFSVPVLPSDVDIPDDDEIIQISKENDFIVIKEATANQRLFFISAWEIDPSFQTTASDQGLLFISGQDGTPTSKIFEKASSHTMEVSQEMWKLAPNLIRVASLAEIYDILHKITIKHEVLYTLTWTNYAHAAVPDDKWSSPLKPILCLEEVASNLVSSDYEEVSKYHIEKGDGYVGKSLELNRPSYIPELRKEDCKYLSKDLKELLLGGLAINLSSRHFKRGDYVVEFLFHHTRTLEKQRWLVDCIISDLRKTKLSFVTYGKQGPVVQLHETAVLNVMRGSLPSQLTSDFGSIAKALNAVDRQRDENVLHLQWPHEQLHGNATSNTKALIKNPVIPSTGDAVDVRGPSQQGIKRRRPLRSEVWDHYEKKKVDGNIWAKCKYCDFETDGSSKRGTSHLKKHFERHHGSSSRGKDEHFDNPAKRMQPFKLQSEKDFGFDDILNGYDKEKEKICRYFGKLSCRFNLTINLWEDYAYKGIVNCCLTVQFIDDNWKLKKKILSFERLGRESITKSLSKIFKKVLLDWDINEKTRSLTIHNSFSNEEIVLDTESWSFDIYCLSYDKCIRDINYVAADISLKSIYDVYKEINQQQSKGYTLMNVESSNNWRYCSLILVIVAILHPNLNLNYVKLVYKEIYGDDGAEEQLKKITNFLVGLYDEYAYSCSNPEAFTTSGDSNYSSLSNVIDKYTDSFRKLQVSNRQELVQYLEEEVSTNFDILNWWHKNRSRFPILEKMARDFLAIPWSTIVSSFAFVNEISKIISNSVQDLKIIRAIICYQDWLELANESACYERFMMELRAWSKKIPESLVWDFAPDELRLLEKWKNPTKTGEIVGMDKHLGVTDKNLAPLALPLDGSNHFDYYVDDKIIDVFFGLLKKRYEEFPSVYLKHYSFDPLMGTMLVSENMMDGLRSFKLEDQRDTCKLFLPLCLSYHWTLFYVDIKDQKFVWLNSLRSTAREQYYNIKRIMEWFTLTLLADMGLNIALNWPLEVPTDIPQQTNSFDCGIFVMKYADCLTHANYIGFPFSQDDMPHFRKRIFLDIYNGRINVPGKFVRR